MKYYLLFLFFILPQIQAWWKNGIIYEVLLPSFKDSNGDGMGDLNGLRQKLDHFTDLNVDAIYVTPFYKTPMVDIGYDISNYTDVDPVFGSMEDFDRLMSEMKKRGLRMIGDLVINHSSDKHPWFQKSIDRIDPYTDYYVWADPKGYDSQGRPLPPNNWMSYFGGSVWYWNDKRAQYYLHQFTGQQPDLNLRNENVKQEIKNLIYFWFDKGVSGFRLDAPAEYMEDLLLRDEPLKDSNKKEVRFRDDLIHMYTNNLPETFEFVAELRRFIDDYTKNHPEAGEKLLVAETWSTDAAMTYYDKKEKNMTQIPFNLNFSLMRGPVTAYDFNRMITEWLRRMPEGATPNWAAENHDANRMSENINEEYRDIIVISQMTLPGVACFYYGQEIGMISPKMRPDQIKCLVVPTPFGGQVRDGARLPMQWDNSINAGFSTNNPWLPVHPNYWISNVETEKNMNRSRYNMFKILSNARQRRTLKYGDFKPYIISNWVYGFVRSYENYETFVVLINLGTETEIFDLHEAIPNLPSNLTVVTSSINAGYKWGNKVPSSPKFPQFFALRPTSAVVLGSDDL